MLESFRCYYFYRAKKLLSFDQNCSRFVNYQIIDRLIESSNCILDGCHLLEEDIVKLIDFSNFNLEIITRELRNNVFS